ncbi:MAG: ATP-binding protein [Thermodesulfobacteriota bacterium]
MLEYLQLKNVGPAPTLELEFGPRINVITGDNGLGKSFLLDIAWWALTRTWASLPARPTAGAKNASIGFRFTGKKKTNEYTSTFDRPLQAWTGKAGRPSNPGLVLYAQVDDSFAVWDPARNYWRRKGEVDVQDRPPAYLFRPQDIWDGLEAPGGVLSNGLIRDWMSWQRENGEPFAQLQAALRRLSPAAEEELRPGGPTRISLDDVRDIPTLKMPYGEEVPVLHASAGMKRIIGLAYLLVWAWQEHRRASELLGQDFARQVIFLIDEIESHLHPRWQRVILRSMLEVVNALTGTADTTVQLITATHSPLLLASLEPLFDEEADRLAHLDLKAGQVRLRPLPWVKQGDTANWLVSEVFGLRQARSLEAEQAIEAAEAWMRGDRAALPATLSSKAAIHRELQRTLAGHDPFWPRWIVRFEASIGNEP